MTKAHSKLNSNMKKTYLIIGGVSTVLILLAIWVYLLIYGTPKPVESFFTDFSFSGRSEVSAELPFVPEPENQTVDVLDDVPLRQLTTRAVIGFGEYKPKNGEKPSILYAEAGTGHVYTIDLTSGVETRLSNITITNAQKAEFNFDGTKVAIRSGYGTQNTIELLTLNGENSATKETLIPKMVDLTFSTDGNLLYSEYSSTGLTAHLMDTQTKTNSNLFIVPFQDATIIWNKDGKSEHYVYPKPSAKLTGFLYRISNGVLLREPTSGNGLGVLVNNDYSIHTITTDRGPLSFMTKKNGGNAQSLPIIMQSSKCVFSNINTNILYCGHEDTPLTYEFPDNWYKGLITFSDKIWEINLDKGLATQLINPQKETGREIDVIGMNMSRIDKVLYFINKNDNTLWMYEI